MAYLDRLNAAIYLSEQVQQSSIKKSSQKWLIWLRDNHAFKNHNGVRIPFKKEGRKSYYDTKELDLVIGQLTLKHSALNAIKQQEAQIKTAKLHIKRSITETDTHIIETTEHPDATITRRTPKAENRIDEVQALKEAIEKPISAKDLMSHTVDKVEGIWWRATATIHPIVENCDGSHTKAVIQFVTCEEPPRVYNLSRNDILALAGSLEAAYDVVLALSGEYAPHLH